MVEEIVPDVPPSVLYSDAQNAASGSWLSANQLEALDSRYPFGAYSEQVQLDLIYAYYKNDDLALGLATISRFLRLNPTREKQDWVLCTLATDTRDKIETSCDIFNIWS